MAPAVPVDAVGVDLMLLLALGVENGGPEAAAVELRFGNAAGGYRVENLHDERRDACG